MKKNGNGFGGLVFQTSRWSDMLWGDHLKASKGAQIILDAGGSSKGASFDGFAQDLHCRLYLPQDPPRREKSPGWASLLHEEARKLPEWERLKAMTARNGFAAGVATEAMLAALHEEIMKLPPDDYEDALEAQGFTGEALEKRKAAMRASLRRASRKARDEVEEAEQVLRGLGAAAGTERVDAVSGGDLAAVRKAWETLKDSQALKRIAELAGRMVRLAASKRRTTVRPSVGEVHGVTVGGDLSRLLPSELAQLRHPKLRLATLARVLERRALCYDLTGKEELSRGPVVVCLDGSASMRREGRDTWAKAAALALLQVASKQRRAFHLVGFNYGVTHEVEVAPGEATLDGILEMLNHRPVGGTSFNAALKRAQEVIQTSRAMRGADVVFVTDGEDSVSPEVEEACLDLSRKAGVSWYVVGVGQDADLESLEGIATEALQVYDTEDPEKISRIVAKCEH